MTLWPQVSAVALVSSWFKMPGFECFAVSFYLEHMTTIHEYPVSTLVTSTSESDKKFILIKKNSTDSHKD